MKNTSVIGSCCKNTIFPGWYLLELAISTIGSISRGDRLLNIVNCFKKSYMSVFCIVYPPLIKSTNSLSQFVSICIVYDFNHAKNISEKNKVQFDPASK